MTNRTLTIAEVCERYLVSPSTVLFGSYGMPAHHANRPKSAQSQAATSVYEPGFGGI